MSAAIFRRLERLEVRSSSRGIALRLAEARRKATIPAGDREENEIERYHRIKFSNDPAESTEALRLRRQFWPRLNR